MNKTLISLITIGLLSLPSYASADELDDQRNAQQASRSASRVAITQNVVATASQYIGVRYCRGGESPRCFDCSGLTQYVYAQQGIGLDRRTHTQYKQSIKITKEEAQPGDLVFFLNKKGYAYHVGIYVGNNQILHSPKPGRKVKIETIWSSRVKFAQVS